nr:MAG TPA: hyaluronidase [Caudoviricetes sp.]DAW25892.1 MAG TPA: hyaluronidase [Caudoviricetes sp.]
MATKTIKGKIQSRIDTSENWSNKNPVLLAGEIGIESDTYRLKAGDGSTSWNNLPYLRGPAETNVSVSIEPSDGAETWIEVPVENLIVGGTEPTDTNALWLEVKE